MTPSLLEVPINAPLGALHSMMMNHGREGLKHRPVDRAATGGQTATARPITGAADNTIANGTTQSATSTNPAAAGGRDTMV